MDPAPHTPDRRAAPRSALTRPCKLYHAPTGRYLLARTTDVSSSGALLRVHGPRPLQVGDQVEVLIAWHERQLLQAADALPARVVRALTREDGVQIAAVEYAAALADARVAA